MAGELAIRPQPEHRGSRRSPLSAAVGFGGSLGAAALGPIWRRTNAAALAGLDAVLASDLAADVVDRVIASRLVDETVDRVIASRLIDETVERVLANGVLDETLERVFASGVLDETIDRVFASGLIDETVDRLLRSDALWLLVERIAQSPAVTEAIAHQGVGFADEVAGGVRARSRGADTWIEARVRRALRRRQRVEAASGEEDVVEVDGEDRERGS